MRLTTILVLLLVTVATAGCAPKYVHRLSEQRYKALPKGTEVRLYQSELDTPHEKIALINSFSSRNDDAETRRRQLEDMKERARRLGAESVTEITPVVQYLRGVIEDQATPFPSPMQGGWARYQFRGVAVRALPPEVEEAPEGEAVEPATDDSEALLTEPAVEELPGHEAIPEAEELPGHEAVPAVE